MTDLKPGDRVRVEFEGDVNYTTPTRVHIDVNGERFSALVHPENCTVIRRPPVKVGDFVDFDALEALPPTAVVRDIDGDIGVKDRDDWSIAGLEHHRSSEFFAQPTTLLWLPS